MMPITNSIDKTKVVETKIENIGAIEGGGTYKHTQHQLTSKISLEQKNLFIH
jgi:hypothetical protein